MTGVKVKICGLTDEAAVNAVIAAKADYAGFVYFPASPRHLAVERAAQLKTLLPSSISSVSVVADADDGLLQHIADKLKPDCLQLHGKETLERVQAIKKKFPNIKIIKAISVKTSDDLAAAMPYADVADALLFDARAPEFPGWLPGGNGLSFDWALLKGREFSRPWFLSGGLNADNVGEAIHSSGATTVDVSSSVERAPGVKDAGLISSFVKAARA